MSRPADPTTRIALLTAAEAVFAERGVAAAKVEEITKRANVSKGAFYLHFATKEDALRAVVEAFLARCAVLVANACEADELPDDAMELLEFCAERDVEMLDFFWQNRAILSILQDCQGPHAYLVEAFRKDVEARTATWIDTLKGRDLFRADVDSSLVSTVMCGAYHELVHKLVVHPKKPPIREWVRHVQAVFVRGLGTPTFAQACAELNAQNSSVTLPRSRGKHESV